MSIADLLEDYFESTADARRAVGERRHRHVGRTPLAGHRVRDGAPQDRRRRRRRARLVGLPRGRHGRRSPQRWPPRPRSFGARSAPTRRSSRSCVRDGRVDGVVLAGGERDRPRHVVVTTAHPKIAFLAAARPRASCPTTSSTTSSAGTPAAGTVKVNLARRPAARVHREARLRPRGARRHDRAGPIARRGRDGVPGRGRRAARRRRRSPTSASRRCSTRRSRPRAITSCRCSPSGCRTSGPTSRMPAELDAYADRVIATGRRGRARIHRVDPAPQGDRPARDGARVRPDRRQHLPRRAVARSAVPHAPGAGLRRLPHADRAACTRPVRRPTAAAA